MNIDDALQKFKDFAELEAYSRAQYLTIVDLTKKLQKAEEEAKHLLGLVGHQPTNIIPSSELLDNEEMICIVQIERLRQISESRELTLEEARKLEIFNKIVAGVRQEKTKDVSGKAGALSNKELIAQLTAGKE